MAQRNETAQRKLVMLQELREARLKGEGLRSNAALSQRELSIRYGLSGYTISLLLQQLVEEGVLYTVPRIGTFLGRPPLETVAPYIFVSDVPSQFNSYVDQMQAGFYDRVAQLGAAGITLSIEEMEWHLAQGNLDSISGAFFFSVPPHLIKQLLERSQTSGVIYGLNGITSEEVLVDTVDFDDEEGGAEATRHLLDRGHRHIAFLGLHTNSRDSQLFHWSVLRESGWRRMMQNAGQDVENLAFLPEAPISHLEANQIEAARQSAVRLIGTSEVTAVLAANFYAAEGLIRALGELAIPTELWPAIVCFDNAPKGGSGISYMRLPWEKIGAEAAQLLWERKTSRTKGIAQRRLVKMNLIPRLSCQRDWALSGLAQGLIKQTNPASNPLSQEAMKSATV